MALIMPEVSFFFSYHFIYLFFLLLFGTAVEDDSYRLTRSSVQFICVLFNCHWLNQSWLFFQSYIALLNFLFIHLFIITEILENIPPISQLRLYCKIKRKFFTSNSHGIEEMRRLQTCTLCFGFLKAHISKRHHSIYSLRRYKKIGCKQCYIMSRVLKLPFGLL